MDKRSLVEQLASKLRASALTAQRAGASAAEMAREGATPSERRDDARVAIEYGGLARGQNRRAEKARSELGVLDTFRPQALPRGAPIALGAVVEVESDDGQGRTFFLAPVGAGADKNAIFALTAQGDTACLNSQAVADLVSPVEEQDRSAEAVRVGLQFRHKIDG